MSLLTKPSANEGRIIVQWEGRWFDIPLTMLRSLEPPSAGVVEPMARKLSYPIRQDDEHLDCLLQGNGRYLCEAGSITLAEWLMHDLNTAPQPSWKACEEGARIPDFDSLAAPQPQAAGGAPSGWKMVPDGLHFGIIDPDYARVFTMARALAWQEGYMLAMHGSFTRDLDLIAVPWTEKPCDADHLVTRIVSAAGLEKQSETPSLKPHGRLVWTLMFPEFSDPRFVDIGVLPASLPDGDAKGGAA